MGFQRPQLLCYVLALLVLTAAPSVALDGMLGIHDPSRVVVCDGHYYVFGTGRGISILTSSDGFTWQRGGRVFDRIPDSVRAYVPKNDGTDVWAPDVIQLNGEYYLYYAISSWGQFVSAVGLVTSPTLDPKDPRYKWTDHGMVVHSVEGENLNAIDPCVFQAPDGTLWISYGSYHGNIQLVQLDPKTGLRIKPNSHVWIIASQSEATYIISHDGYYYLLVNHGSCCQGPNSTYNIRVGRSKKVTGPYLDRHGEDMARGGGTLFLAAAGKKIGPGQFGLLTEDGVEKFSCHYEADLDRGGRPTLDIRPLLWTADGWPQPGEDVQDGTYQMLSQQTGTNVQVPPGAAAEGSPAQLARYLVQDNQEWTITPASGGFYKIIGVASGKALEAPGSKPEDATAAGAVTIATFTGTDDQLWKIDQVSDGSYRIESKVNQRALTAVTAGPLALQAYHGDDTQKWVLSAP